MMPSESDRHAWLELLISVGVLFGIALLFGAGPWMLSNIAPRLSNFLSSVAVIFGLSAFVHILLILPSALIHKLLAQRHRGGCGVILIRIGCIPISSES